MTFELFRADGVANGAGKDTVSAVVAVGSPDEERFLLLVQKATDKASKEKKTELRMVV